MILINVFSIQTLFYYQFLERKCDTKQIIQGTFALLPAASYLIGGVLFARFAFNEIEHRAARQVIEERA